MLGMVTCPNKYWLIRENKPFLQLDNGWWSGTKKKKYLYSAHWMCQSIIMRLITRYHIIVFEVCSFAWGIQTSWVFSCLSIIWHLAFYVVSFNCRLLIRISFSFQLHYVVRPKMDIISGRCFTKLFLTWEG